ncbi:MAG: LD-carboxypeptidase [Myxococcota bacterium]
MTAATAITKRAQARPPRVEPGGRAHVVAPSGPVPAERFERGLRVLRRALPHDYVLAENLQEQEGYFAGSDRQRLDALHRALQDADADAIFCARGGYGATRLLASLDPSGLTHRPKPIVGFSDVTALLCWALVRAGVPSIHGPVITQLSSLEQTDVDRLVDMLRGEVPAPLTAEEGSVLRGGTVEGPLVAGNLEILRSLVGTRYMPRLDGCLLALEEIGERPYRIDRCLTQLIASGALRGVRGVIVGRFLQCDEPDNGNVGPDGIDVVLERLTTLGVPVVTGFPFGHGPGRNAALPVGVVARLHADDCTLEVLEPVTGTA